MPITSDKLSEWERDLDRVRGRLQVASKDDKPHLDEVVDELDRITRDVRTADVDAVREEVR